MINSRRRSELACRCEQLDNNRRQARPISIHQAVWRRKCDLASSPVAASFPSLIRGCPAEGRRVSDRRWTRNPNPATIFLGDCGSLFIGFMLSALALAGSQKAPTLVAVAIPVVSFELPVLETVLSVIRRFLSGQPLFTADHGHIHHKLLERGLSQRQVVFILYAASAICGLLSLFLLYPSGPTVGIVLFVIGAGIWVGVQHLGYHEFGELGRVAHRTMEQKKVIVNNLAIRRATEALSSSKDMRSVERVLRDAFESNDFDGFNLRLSDIDSASAVADHNAASQVAWRRPNGKCEAAEAHGPSEWSLTLDLTKVSGEKLGTFSLYRQCNGHPLLVDVNLLISGFNTALTEALDCASQKSPASFAKERSAPIDLDSGSHRTTTAP